MIRLENKPEQIELIKAIGSKDVAVSRKATEAFAAAIGTVIAEVLRQASTASLIYEDQPFSEDESPSFPLDLFYNEDVGHVTTWSQEIAGGLPSSQIEGVAEMKITTYRLDSAVNFLKKYARKHNLNVLSKAVDKMIQEILVKQERMAWAPVLRALGEATTKGLKHTVSSAAANTLLLADFSKIITRAKRLNQSFAGGTAENVYSRGITDLFVSPEIKEQIRGFVYQPMNTRASVSAGTPNNLYGPAVALPDNIREEIYRNTGADEVYGISLVELQELGLNQKYNKLFAEYASGNIAVGDSTTFVAATHEICVGVDTTKGALIRAVATDADNGSTFTVQPDDQWVTRSEKVGFYGALEEGRVIIDARAIMGLVC